MTSIENMFYRHNSPKQERTRIDVQVDRSYCLTNARASVSKIQVTVDVYWWHSKILRKCNAYRFFVQDMNAEI